MSTQERLAVIDIQEACNAFSHLLRNTLVAAKGSSPLQLTQEAWGDLSDAVEQVQLQLDRLQFQHLDKIQVWVGLNDSPNNSNRSGPDNILQFKPLS